MWIVFSLLIKLVVLHFFFSLLYLEPQKFSKDGYEEHMQVNHLAPALLSILLLPSLIRGSPSRIVNVNSVVSSVTILYVITYKSKCAWSNFLPIIGHICIKHWRIPSLPHEFIKKCHLFSCWVMKICMWLVHQSFCYWFYSLCPLAHHGSLYIDPLAHHDSLHIDWIKSLILSYQYISFIM